ncbi:MAG: helix-turn-helix domain-containing protein [Clostridiales bacterium]|nr:helix-turn-helix domain-containing protein [Clostridiales bacterium]
MSYKSEVDNIFNNFDEMPMFISVPQAAETLGISSVSLYKLIQTDKTFPVVIIGRRKSIPKEQLKQWIQNNCTR